MVPDNPSFRSTIVQILHLRSDACLQEFDGALKIVKVEADPCPNLVEKYKVSVNVSYLTLFYTTPVPSSRRSSRIPVEVCAISRYFALALLLLLT